MPSRHFYSRLPTFPNFIQITDPANYFHVPNDWYILSCDIENSMEAIITGKYREINLISAATIAAVLNLGAEIELPFIFGGDSSYLLIPGHLLTPAKATLLAVKKLAKELFGFRLRIAAVPVQNIYNEGHRLGIAKFQVSPSYAQAIFVGEGLEQVENLVKGPNQRSYELSEAELENGYQPDLSGLECRWEDIASSRGETISLIIKVRALSELQAFEQYKNIMQQLEQIYGQVGNYHPVANSKLILTLQASQFNSQIKLKHRPENWLTHQSELYRLQLANLVGIAADYLKRPFRGIDMIQHRRQVIAATDFQKFDGTLRLVISGAPSQTNQLEAFLTEGYNQGKLGYGLHRSDRAHLTSLIFSKSGREVHFVDAAGGGYALAAKQLKQHYKH